MSDFFIVCQRGQTLSSISTSLDGWMDEWILIYDGWCLYGRMSTLRILLVVARWSLLYDPCICTSMDDSHPLHSPSIYKRWSSHLQGVGKFLIEYLLKINNRWIYHYGWMIWLQRMHALTILIGSMGAWLHPCLQGYTSHQLTMDEQALRVYG